MRDYEEGQRNPPCVDDQPCVVTKRGKVRLNYEEYRIFNDFMDYVQTGQILTRDRRKREMILSLNAKLEEWKKMTRRPDANPRP